MIRKKHKHKHKCKAFIGMGDGVAVCVECGKAKIYDFKKVSAKLKICGNKEQK